MKRDNILKIKSFAFAVRIVNLYRYLTTEKKEFVLSKQLLKCGTSIGAMVSESEHSESKLDFIHKLAIAQKENNETIYWLELLFTTKYLEEIEYKSLNEDAIELIKIITSIIVKTKQNKENNAILNH